MSKFPAVAALGHFLRNVADAGDVLSALDHGRVESGQRSQAHQEDEVEEEVHEEVPLGQVPLELQKRFRQRML